MHQNAGTCLSIKIGHTGMDTKKLLANVEKSIPAVTRKLYAVNKKRKNGERHKLTVKEGAKPDEEKLKEREDAWGNIQSLGIKTHSSVCLPIWSCALNERWVVPTPTATASSSKENGVPTDLPETIKSIPKEKGGDDDDTMSEGEGSEEAEEKRLSKKLARSSLNGPVKVTKRLGEEPQADSRKQKKKRKADDGAEDSTPLASVPTKKSKKAPTDSVSSLSPAVPSKRKEHAALVPSDSSSKSFSIPEKGTEKVRKGDRAKAVDFMEEDTPAAKESQKPKKKEQVVSTSSPFAAADAALRAHRKDKKRDKVQDETTGPPALPSAGAATSASLVGTDASTKAHKTDKKGKVTTEPSSGTATGTSQASVKTPSKIVSKPSSTTPPSGLKSALRKPSTPGSGLTPSELSEKKAKRATFSVIEKKKEKMGKGVIGGSGGKSGKSGKSKASLVGRGPKM
jgi:ribosome biogenesis protein UTP30